MGAEVWKDVVGFEERYEVSSFGKVRSKSFLKRGRTRNGPIEFFTKPRLLKGSLSIDGYLRVTLQAGAGSKKIGVAVHRLVAKAFIPNPENKPQVNHKDSVRTNNIASNLEWVTAKENVSHSFEHGVRSHTGEKHPRAVLTEEIVRKIKHMSAMMGCTAIALELGLERSTVSKVVHNNNWSYVV
jgi:hypothetical protein